MSARAQHSNPRHPAWGLNTGSFLFRKGGGWKHSLVTSSMLVTVDYERDNGYGQRVRPVGLVAALLGFGGHQSYTLARWLPIFEMARFGGLALDRK